MNFPLVTPRLADPNQIQHQISSSITLAVRGRVAAITGDTVELEGMTAPIGAICELNPGQPNECLARVIGFRSVRPILAPMETMGQVAAGDPVRLVSRSTQLRVGDSLCGRVVDAFGRPVDDRPLPDDLRVVDADSDAPNSLDRPPIDTPIQTGVKAIDSMLTCGIGQRIGIFAGSGVGKSTLLGMLARGTNADRIVIGMVGERGREVKEFMERCLGAAGMKKTVVVVATSDRPAAQRVGAAWTATAIAESFRDEGKNVLLLIDSVTRFAMAQRELGLAAGEPPTTRGYPPSVFNMLPRLVERAGRTNQGSITAFYTVLVEGDDNNEPIADTLRGLLDGHIILSRALTSESHWPPIDVLESLSRLQPHLVSEEVSAAAESARRHLSEYRRNADLISIGAYRGGSDPRIDVAIAMREPLKGHLTQHHETLTDLHQSQADLVTLAKASAGLSDNLTAQNLAATNAGPNAAPDTAPAAG